MEENAKYKIKCENLEKDLREARERNAKYH